MNTKNTGLKFHNKHTECDIAFGKFNDGLLNIETWGFYNETEISLNKKQITKLKTN